MSRQPANGYRDMSNGSNPSRTASGMSSQQRLATPTMNSQRPMSPAGNPAMSRAERFEDEKKRIIQSCFSKLDANGQLAESYITHIRITEDSGHPSTPPPPDSPEANKKPRLIIIAVRSTGRVRMHKARENNNGSFSIGKTWNLEELSAIETFGSSAPPQSSKEEQYRSWAESTGFTVTITKPYYWQAGTSKEKDFFIASAVKIYRKYTKGQTPELRGFDEKEKNMMLGGMPQQQQQQPRQVSQPQESQQSLPSTLTPGMRAESWTGSREMSPMAPPEPPQPPFAQRPQSREESRYRGSPGPPPSLHDPGRPGSGAQSRQPSESRFAPPASGPRPFASQEHMRARSREGREGYRPGTSPAPAPGQGFGRSPRQLQTPSLPSARSESPGGSSLASSAGPGRQAVRPISPVRPPRGYEHSISSVSEDQRDITPQPKQGQWSEPERDTAPPEQANGGSVGAAAGASLFASTRQRWQQAQIAPQQRPTSPAAPQLPPIETSQPLSNGQQKSGEVWNSQTAASEASSAGINLDDAAAIGALTSYWGPDPSTPVHAATPQINEPSSPPTPQRSARRPQLDDVGRGQSEASVDLRPPPLKQSTRSEDGSNYATPQDRSAQPSIVGTPRMEEPPEIKPLSVQKRQSNEPRPESRQREEKLKIPGAFTPNGPSPLGTPSEQPSTVTSEPAALQQRQVEAEAEKEIQAEQPAETDASYRPGLGPMIKKSAVRDKFKKAATAAQAFKPRPGGAAEKIMRAKAEREAGLSNGDNDGVSGFVPRPGAAPAVSTPREEKAAPVVEPATLAKESTSQEATPKVEVFSPTSPVQAPSSASIMDPSQNINNGVELHDDAGPATPEHLQTPDQQREAEEEEAEKALFEQRELRKQQIKNRRRSNHQKRNLAALGIDPALLEGKGLDFEHTLEDFGWTDKALEPKKLAELEADLRREQGRLEAGAWLSHTDAQRDEKISQVDGLLDKAIAECDDLEGLLTLYKVELGTLDEDIAFIEAQSQGLQVQSANQKALKKELEGLVETMSLDRRVLEPLRSGDFADPQGLDVVEHSLSRLYQAMITTDPSIRTSAAGRPKSRGGVVGDGSSELSQMRALQEKRDVYGREAELFTQRLMQHLDQTFSYTLNGAKSKILRPASGGTKRLNKDVFPEARRPLWPYSPLVLFTKELNQPAWQTVQRMYYTKASILYSEAFRENISGWRRAAKRTGPDEEALLFTSLEKEEASGGSGNAGLNAARKLTIKRSQTMAKALRTASGGNRSPTESRHPGQMMSSEAFAGSMDEMAPLILQEQNFVVDMFHVTSLETADFLEAVNTQPPDRRVGTNLLQARPIDPDREMAHRVTSVVDEVFSFFTQEMTTMLEWAVKEDPLQGVGIMANLGRHSFYLQEGGQEFILRLLEALTSKLQNLWAKFVDEQVRAIEDTKVKIKKRKGVIGFVKIFPHFAAAVENIFSAVAQGDYDKAGEGGPMFEVRKLVGETYARLNRAMFDSLKVIAKESPVHAAQSKSQQLGAGAGDDPEDKEMLNYHILLIENMNHYIEEVDDGDKQGVLAEWKGKAMLERAEAMDEYVSRVMKRPLGKLLDFLDSIESLLTSHPNAQAISSRPSFSRKAARSTFSAYDSKEIRKGIETLRRRIEKHFGDADEEVISRNLVAMVCKECERAYEKTIDRMERVIKEVYPQAEGEKSVEVDFSREDVKSGFRR